MVTIEKRLKEIAYIFNKKTFSLEQKNKEVVFFICEELKEGDFKTPFFNKSQIINLYDGFKFFSYCGINQNKNINKNALVVTKKLKKGNKFIYRCYLMEKEYFNITDLFIKNSKPKTIKENNYNLNPKEYINTLKDEYSKEEIIYIFNKILNDLTEWSLKQK